MDSILPPSTNYGWPSISMMSEKVVSLTQSLMDAGVEYRLGAKADPLSSQAGEFGTIDCSGFVRWATFHATGLGLTIPDGSCNQHDWVIAQRFKVSDFQSGELHDGAVRIAFLTPRQGGGIGHVMLIVNGQTCESHGGHGPDRRTWGSCGFMRECAVYVLAGPSQ